MRLRVSWPLILGGLVCLGLLVPGVLVPLARGAAPVSFQDIEESLTCQCGCGLTVHSCNHLQCGSAIPLREEIRAQMDQGMGKDAILAYFSNKYGEKILSSPTTTGFNLVAWITPFVLVALGGVFVGVTLLRWSARGRPAPEPVAPAAPHTASPYDKILEKELKDFEG
jgi:cytochrome c-type biogenesis protein CcmH/NrfF